ncbi:hypothetical protein OSTOST_06640, partial [Ostertagia ostertagi]
MFGSDEVTENWHGVVKVKLLDKIRSPVLTAHAKKASLTKEDLHVINRKRIQLSSKLDEKPHSPQILLGCDYLWDVMEQQNEMLPSGLYLISTKFGYMISGRQYEP